ncbi:hypothetical protein C8R44DRAFT_885241 [Mycena epipterygia]|nr:hypothetical protein C8R44DRAFT_885241 [Mycena epipterygia]
MFCPSVVAVCDLAYFVFWLPSSNDMDGLPMLTASASRHPSSYASLSLPLLDLLDAVLPPPSELTLSVGSGTGLLKALSKRFESFLQHQPHRSSPDSFLGVEVA